MKRVPASLDINEIDTTARCFDELDQPIFLGAGEVSGFAISVMRARMQYGIECLGTIQLSRSDDELAEVPGLRAEIEDVIRDIAKALTGKTISFEEV